MRLLLDEHYDPDVARQLVRKGYDVVAVAGSPIQGYADPQVLAAATADRRALLTENVRDFAPLHSESLRAAREHYGLVLVAHRSFDRSKRGIGRLVRAIEAFMRDRPEDDALRDSLVWLTEPSDSRRPR